MKNQILTLFFLIVAATIFSIRLSAQSVSADDLKNWVYWLSSDDLKGRANGSPESGIAAEWISQKFADEGLKPVLTDGNFIQNYSFAGRNGQNTDERNVIGMIPGSDPVLKNEYIFITAHFDHIGIRKGMDTDSICNGADDNAAGTITLISIAKAIQESGLKPGRSLVFAAFSGEERGMRGSRYFVSNCPFPLKNIYADINFEMTGHSEAYGRHNYYMTGCQLSNLDDIIKSFPGAGDITLIDTIKMAEALFYASDNIAFSRMSVSPEKITTGIPSGTFATTTMAPYIHSVKDEADKFDYTNMADLATYFTKVILWLSGNSKEINWTDPSFTRPK